MKRILITFLLPFVIGMMFVLKKYILMLSTLMPECIFRSSTGLLCIGCGNTRALREMLSLNFITAARYNITLPLIAVFLIVWYVEAVITVWIKPVKLLPRRYSFYIVLGVLFCVYHVLRNFVNFMP